MNVKNRTLFIADNLDIMRGIDSETIDLIYLDPPFNTKKQYQAPIGSPAAGASFKDIWTDEDIKDEWHGEIAEQHQELYQIIQASEILYDKSMKIYTMAMAVRLFEMKRILKLTGSIYLHCDPTASHYLKLVMDSLFGKNNFRAEIVWQRHNAHNDKLYGSIHDTIFYYSYGEKEIPSEVLIPLSDERIEDFDGCDEHGKYEKGDLKGPRTSEGESGEPWRGVDPAATADRCWSVPRTGRYAEYIEKYFIPNYRSIVSVHARLDALDEAGLIVWSSRGNPRLKRYLTSDAGMPPQSMWYDILPVQKDEDTGYPTQKPLTLLERIIKASSNEGDIVLDPFCGCATACVAAEQLGRHWIGIDISADAEDITKLRLQEEVDSARLEPDNPSWFNPLIDVIVSSDPPTRTQVTATPRQILITDLFRLPPPTEYSQEQLQEFRSNKHRMYGNQEGRCNGCNELLPFRNMTIDHIHAQSIIADPDHPYHVHIPQSIIADPDHPDNLQLLCAACNSTKGDRPQEYLINKLREDEIIS